MPEFRLHWNVEAVLASHVFSIETRQGMLGIVDALRLRSGIQGVILGGTELPLLLKQSVHNDVIFFDTTAIHVERIVAELVA